MFPEVYSKTPSCLHDFDVINIDGKKLKDLPKRLLPARKLKGNIFGGKKEFPAADLLEVYAHRWDIEQLFQRVTEVYCLNEWISSTPKATIFQAAYCFFLSNTILTVRAFLANSQDVAPEEVSEYQVQYDVRGELTAWCKMLDPDCTSKVLGEIMTPGRLRQYLQRLLSTAWSNRYNKTKQRC